MKDISPQSPKKKIVIPERMLRPLIPKEAIIKIANEIGISTKQEGSLLLIRYQDCKKLLEVCAENNIVVLGFEGFRIPGGIQPDIGLIADFSEVLKNQKTASSVSIRLSQDFLEKRSRDTTDIGCFF